VGWDRALLGRWLDGDAGSDGAFWVGSQVKDAREFRTAGHSRGHEKTKGELFHGWSSNASGEARQAQRRSSARMSTKAHSAAISAQKCHSCRPRRFKSEDRAGPVVPVPADRGLRCARQRIARLRFQLPHPPRWPGR